MARIARGDNEMKLAVVILSITVEVAFIVYCIHMTYLLDVLDPLPRERMIPNLLIGAAILGFGYLVVVWMNKSLAMFAERK
jgi:hypothetical protein